MSHASAAALRFPLRKASWRKRPVDYPYKAKATVPDMGCDKMEAIASKGSRPDGETKDGTKGIQNNRSNPLHDLA